MQRLVCVMHSYRLATTTVKMELRSLNKFEISTHYVLSVIIIKTDDFHSIHEIL